MAGTIRKRGDKYQLMYMFKGKRYSKTVEALSDREAQKLLSRFIVDVEDNVDKEIKTKLNFDKVVKEYMSNYVEKELRKTTESLYYYLYESRLKDYFGKIKIDEIKRSDIINFLENYSDVLTQSTLKKYRNFLSGILNYAIQKEYIQQNVAEKIKLPKGKVIEKQPNFYSFKLIEELIEEMKKECEHSEQCVCVQVLAYTGMRRSEALPLLVSDIDFEKNTIKIDKALVRATKYGNILSKPKSKNSIRIISIPDKLAVVLKEYIENNNLKENLFNLKPEYITKWFRTYINKKNIEHRKNKKGNTEDKYPHLTLHGLRHSYATHLVLNNQDIVTVSSLLGHSSVIITGQIYVEKSNELQKEAVSIFDTTK